jgi:hypothetical protein
MGRTFSFGRAGAAAARSWSGRSPSTSSGQALAPLEKTRGFGMTPVFSDARRFLAPLDEVWKACSALVDRSVGSVALPKIKNTPQRLKPKVIAGLTARLKSCPSRTSRRRRRTARRRPRTAWRQPGPLSVSNFR